MCNELSVFAINSIARKASGKIASVFAMTIELKKASALKRQHSSVCSPVWPKLAALNVAGNLNAILLTVIEVGYVEAEARADGRTLESRIFCAQIDRLPFASVE